MSDSVTKSELVTGMLKSGDIASNILNAINFAEDSRRTNEIMKAVETQLNTTLKTTQDLVRLAMLDGYTILKKGLVVLPQDSLVLTRFIRDQLMQSSAGYHMTASLLGQQAKLYAQQNFSDLYATLISEIPKGFVSEKVKRYYNKVIQSFRFSPEMATRLWNKSKVNEAYWRDTMLEYGIPKIEQDLILDEIEEKPNVGTLLRMYQYIDMPDTAINYILNENNVTDPMIKALWIKYFHAQRLRDEMMEYKLYLKRAFQSGLINSTQLETELKTFKASQEEIDAIITTQEAEFNRTLLSTEQETRTWLYRKGLYNTVVEVTSETTSNGAANGSTAIDSALSEANDYYKDMYAWITGGEIRKILSWDLTSHTLTFVSPFSVQVLSGVAYTIYTETAEETFYTALAALNIDLALVNAIVRLEASKKSIDWESQ